MSLSDWPRDGRATLLAATLGIGFGVSAAVIAARGAGWFEALELAAYDRFLRARSLDAPGSERVAIVRIREEEIARHGHPLPDAILVQALEAIAAQQPRAIGLDLYRAPPRIGDSTEGWDALSALFASDSRLILIEKLPQRGDPGVRPPEFAAGSGRVGFSDVVTDADGVVRRGLLILWPEDGPPALSLPLRLALTFLREEGLTMSADPERPEWVRLGNTTLPAFEADDGAYVDADAAGYQTLLDFEVAPEGLPSYHLEALLAGRLPEGAFHQRVVLLGTTSHSVKDDFVTAHSAGARVSGVALHALATDQLLRAALDGDAPVRHWPDAAEMAFVASLGLSGALAVYLAPNVLVLGGLLLGILGGLYLSAWWAFSFGLWIPWLPPGFAALASSGLVLIDYHRRERAERRAVMDLFGRYVSRSVADELWRRRDEFMDGGRPRPQRLIVTAMLTDLKGYTTAAETLDAESLMAWVNEYMDAMTVVVEKHGGFVDDYTGDGIKANFGAPLAETAEERIRDDAIAAVRCSLEMGSELERLAVGWRERGLPVAPMRVGLFTGEAVGGNLGSSERMKYTTVGDTINTAARLESLHKERIEPPNPDGSGPLFRILIGHTTRRHLGDAFELEDLGEHELRGRVEAVRVYRVWAAKEAS